MPIETIDPETYRKEKAICDAAAEYARQVMVTRGKRCNYLTAEEAAAPVYAACTNEMRGRVEQYEILRDLPETIVAYIGSVNAGSDGVRAMLSMFIIKRHFCGTDVKLYVDLQDKTAELTVSHKRRIKRIETVRPSDWQHVTTPEKAERWLSRPMGERDNATEYLHWLASTGRLDTQEHAA